MFKHLSLLVALQDWDAMMGLLEEPTSPMSSFAYKAALDQMAAPAVVGASGFPHLDGAFYFRREKRVTSQRFWSLVHACIQCSTTFASVKHEWVWILTTTVSTEPFWCGISFARRLLTTTALSPSIVALRACADGQLMILLTCADISKPRE